jgi:3-hydroxyacyl-CoA dehydrogenase
LSLIFCAVQVGADVGMHVGANFVDSFPERVVKSHMIPLLNESGRLGEKTGKGFYKYDKRKQMPDPEFVQPMLKKSQQMAGLGEVRSSLSSQDTAVCGLSLHHLSVKSLVLRQRCDASATYVPLLDK